MVRGWVAFLVLLIGTACWATPAAAANTQLTPEFCTLGTSSTDGPPTMSAFAAGENCGKDRFRDTSPMIWGRVSTELGSLPARALTYMADPSAFDRVVISASYSDGTRLIREFGPEQAADSWMSPARMLFAIPFHDAPLSALYIGVERPQSLSFLSSGTIMPKAAAAATRVERAALFGFILGFTVLPIFFNIAFFGVLRQRFIITHGVLIMAAALYTFSSSGLIFEVMPDLSLMTRWQINNWAFAISTSAASMFLVDFLEKDMISPPMKRLLFGMIPIVLAATLMSAHGGETFRIVGRDWWYLSLLPWLLVYILSIFVAIRRGSRAAKFLALSWCGIILTSGERVFRQIFGLEATVLADSMLYFSLMIETLVTSLGVADRFMLIRRERDRATAREVELMRLADTDGLTGLMNRRAFERLFSTRKPDAVAILDIDHFKAVNDTFGHQTGDDALRAVAHALQGLNGDEFRPCRLGGEEFAVALYGVDAKAALERINGARHGARDHAAAAVPALDTPLTLSAGVANCGTGTLADCLERADWALYRAKDAGRDRAFLAATDDMADKMTLSAAA